MPKDRRVNSFSFHRARVSPYACSSKTVDQDKSESSLPPVGDEKEWEEARCPICMEHPHNAVLLLCSSSGKGCRPFMCNTSHRHSNCLDQFSKSAAVGSSVDASERLSLLFSQATSLRQDTKFVCPLCRGQVSGWVVIEPARKFMNAKQRSCSSETCNFTGNYSELRKHARLEHPSVRPTEADPRRQSEWRRLERERDIDDTISAYQSFGEVLDEDLLDDIQLDGSIFDFFSGMHSETEDDWSDGGSRLMDFEFELDFSFLTDISEPMDFSSMFHNQGSTRSSTSSRSRSRSRYFDAEGTLARRSNTRPLARRRNSRPPGLARNTNQRNTNQSYSWFRGSWR